MAALPDIIGQTIGEMIAAQTERASAEPELEDVIESIRAEREAEMASLPVQTAVAGDVSGDLIREGVIDLVPGEPRRFMGRTIAGSDQASDTLWTFDYQGMSEKASYATRFVVDEAGVSNMTISRADGTSYSAQLTGETGRYSFPDLHLTVTREVPLAIRFLRASAGWVRTDPTMAEGLLRAAGGLTGIILSIVTPDNQFTRDLRVATETGVDAFRAFNASNVESGFYSQRVADDLWTIAPYALTGAALAVGAGAARRDVTAAARSVSRSLPRVRVEFPTPSRTPQLYAPMTPPVRLQVLPPVTSYGRNINPRLINRLEAWRRYDGNLDLQHWVRSTQGHAGWGLGGRSGYADWIRSLESVHGNSRLSSRQAYLYRLFDNQGQFLKWGVTQDISVRFSGAFARKTSVVEYHRGTRADMLRLERGMVETAPGPLNFEPWAGRGREP